MNMYAYKMKTTQNAHSINMILNTLSRASQKLIKRNRVKTDKRQNSLSFYSTSKSRDIKLCSQKP